MKVELIGMVVTAVFASAGFWSFVTTLYKRRSKKVDAEGMMLRGLAHDRICYLGMQYVKKGYVTRDEYENLYNDLYKPYMSLGGNGVATRVMGEVDKLPIRDN